MLYLLKYITIHSNKRLVKMEEIKKQLVCYMIYRQAYGQARDLYSGDLQDKKKHLIKTIKHIY